MSKIFYSVELAPNYEDDTICGTYEECIGYLMTNEYTPKNARIVKYRIDRGGKEQILCECDIDLQEHDDPEVVEIIEDWYTSFAENLKQLRNRMGITQKRLSELTNIPLRTIEDWSTGKRTPSPYMIELIACKLRYMGY